MKGEIRRFVVAVVAALVVAPLGVGAQEAAQKYPPQVKFEGDGDHRNMMEQLGIEELRPGADPNDQSTFDEATANPYLLPDLMTMKDGTKVTSPEQWPARRAELAEEFEREIYGRIPPNVPKVTWSVKERTEGEVAGVPVVTKELVGHVDNSDYPLITVDIKASVTTPAKAPGPVPVMVELNAGWPTFGKPTWKEQLVAKGWGYATIDPGSIQADKPELTSGIIGLTNRGQPRKPEDWGALRAWQWGVSRLVDYFETDPAVDAKQVGIEGLSRYGKAALVTVAFEPRIAIGFVGSSGEGGTKPHRRIFGELVENLTGGYYYWMGGNFLKYGAKRAVFGEKTAADLPVDAHELIAMAAPRPLFVSYGVVEKGDAKWVDARGSFMATVAAGPAYRLLGKRDLGTPGNYLTDEMPPVGTLVGGELAWRQHEGGHSVTENWPAFIEWASQFIHAPVAKPSIERERASGIYDVGERVRWTVDFPEGATGEWRYEVRKDNMRPIVSGTLDAAAKRATIEVTPKEPEMLYAEIWQESGDRKQSVAAGVAVAPTKLRPSTPRPPDFDRFWAGKIAALEKVPATPVLTPKESDRPGVEYATIRMDNVAGAKIHGQFAKPAKPGKFPALLILQWASPPYPLQKSWVTERAAQGWLTLNVEPHDVLPDEPQSYYDALPDELKHYESINRDDRDTNYFLRMYLGDYRAAKYLASRPEWDGKTFVVMGTSMGGQQSFAVAGLFPKVTHMIVNVPSGADTNGSLHGRAAGYPNWPSDDPKAMRTALYFDAVNFASRITATSLVAMGFVDTTSPPVGIWIAYNQIKGPKEAAPMPDSPHNHLATPEQLRPFTSRSEEWLTTLASGGEVHPDPTRARPDGARARPAKPAAFTRQPEGRLARRFIAGFV